MGLTLALLFLCSVAGHVSANMRRTYDAVAVCYAPDGYVWRVTRSPRAPDWPRVLFQPRNDVMLASDALPVSIPPGASRYYRSTLRSPLASMVPLGVMYEERTMGEKLTLYAASAFMPVADRDGPRMCFCDIDVRCSAKTMAEGGSRPLNMWVSSLENMTLPDVMPGASGTFSVKSKETQLLMVHVTDTTLSFWMRQSATLAMLIIATYALVHLVYQGANILPSSPYATLYRHKVEAKRMQTMNAKNDDDDDNNNNQTTKI